MLGENIKKYRLLLNISIKEMSKRTGISCQMLEKYEEGKATPNSTMLIEIAKVLGVKITNLVN